MKKKTLIPRKKRGPPATGIGEPVVVRMHPPMLESLDKWIAMQQQPFPSRPEAVRRLVELGLSGTAKLPSGRRSEKSAAKAKELAAKTIDRLADDAAPAEEQASRKRHLLKGPAEFRGVRVDRAKKK
jgi:Arc/MetJ-type ribon-helix-helix transcriptional regulator